jgi:hypothetical protein
LGLSNLVANKTLLEDLVLKNFSQINTFVDGHNALSTVISSEGFHCLSTLTSLTNLTVQSCQLDDIGLNKICSSCLKIKYLSIEEGDNYRITKEGLNNIHCLIHLKSFCLSNARDDWLAKLSHNTALTYISVFHL